MADEKLSCINKQCVFVQKQNIHSKAHWTNANHVAGTCGAHRQYIQQISKYRVNEICYLFANNYRYPIL